VAEKMKTNDKNLTALKAKNQPAYRDSKEASNLNNGKKWGTLTLINNEVRIIAQLFNSINIKTTFKTTNTIENHFEKL
jgi:hypothetical protein